MTGSVNQQKAVIYCRVCGAKQVREGDGLASQERERLLLEEKQSRPLAPRLSFEQVFELAMGFLANPWKIYAKGSLALKRMALKLAFKEPVAYDRKTGVRTSQPADIFMFLGNFSEECKMVPPRRKYYLFCNPLIFNS